MLPPPEGHGPAALNFSPPPLPATPPGLLGPLPTTAPLAAAPLRKRQQQAAAQAAALRRALHEAGKRTARQVRRQWAVAVLQAAPPPAWAGADGTGRFGHWLATLAADVRAAAPIPAAAAAQALAQLRLRALEAEADALGQLLAAATS